MLPEGRVALLLILIIACESLRIRWGMFGNNPTPQTKGAIKLVPTNYVGTVGQMTVRYLGRKLITP